MSIKHSAFTMVELIFVIVIIGILAAVGLPKLSGVSDGAKKTAEIATISAVSTAIETAHGEWSINENSFTWGTNQSSSALNSVGYPSDLSANNKVFGALLKKDADGFAKIATLSATDYNATVFTGPASNKDIGVKFDTKAPNGDITGKPDKNDFWVYLSYILPPKTSCVDSINGKIFFAGDIQLIDITGTATPNYTLTFTCN
ncbi:MAG: type II secretion system protein [Sulfurospirillaceae bacterium]|nr:type II secretion system protein [Sulfurospirillaceae bacterium]MDD2825834.1 type II secretion system protein [Sulfurospirillaceae bacterium]